MPGRAYILYLFITYNIFKAVFELLEILEFLPLKIWSLKFFTAVEWISLGTKRHNIRNMVHGIGITLCGDSW